MTPNQDQVLSLIRSLIAVVGGYAIGHGWLNADQITLIGGIAASLVPLVWGLFAHTTSAKLASVEALPQVKKIVVATVPSDGVNDSSVTDAARDTTRPKVVLDTAVQPATR